MKHLDFIRNESLYAYIVCHHEEPGDVCEWSDPVVQAPLSLLCPNQKYALIDDGMGELAVVSGAARAAAHYHAHSL